VQTIDPLVPISQSQTRPIAWIVEVNDRNEAVEAVEACLFMSKAL